MKKIFFLCLAAFLSGSCFAQTKALIGSKSFICSYYGEPVRLPLTVVNSSDDAQRAIAAITDVVGLEGNFEIKEAAVPNAAAIIFNSKRYILYNPRFINGINDAAGDKWAAIAILAHEIGHHLDGHTLAGSGSHPESELQADEFSGFVLRKMGASLEQAQSAIDVLADVGETATHPAKGARLISIDNGWTKADAQINGKRFVAKAISRSTPQTIPASVNNSSGLDPKFIRYNLFFNADPEGKYYITTQNNFVTVKNGRLMVLGKLIQLQGDNYLFGIKIDEQDFFLVTSDGKILSKSGKRLGKLKDDEDE